MLDWYEGAMAFLYTIGFILFICFFAQSCKNRSLTVKITCLALAALYLVKSIESISIMVENGWHTWIYNFQRVADGIYFFVMA